MKKKELKKFAVKIAKLEKIVQSATDAETKKKAEIEIMKISTNIGNSNFEDLIAIDELIEEMRKNGEFDL